MTTDWNKLIEEHELAYFRGNLTTSSPQSYTLDEMREISEAMDASTAELEAAMCADFWPMPADARSRMMELLGVPSADPNRAVS